MLCADMVALFWKDRSGRSCRVAALLEDISSSGACLQTETAIPLGAEVRWQRRRKSLAGEVRYCVYREIGYFVGVEFYSGSRWSKQDYLPDHSLDLQHFLDRNTK